MTPVQLNTLNAEIWKGIGAIADNESLMRRLSKFVSKLVKEKESDPTHYSKEDFYARIDEAKKGPSYELKDGETIEDLIQRIR